MDDGRLVSDSQLADLAVVANCDMNRERQLRGSNGYARELGIDVVEHLEASAAGGRSVAWVDLCCGSGRALQEAAEILAGTAPAIDATIIGVDLIGTPPPAPNVTIVESSIATWSPDARVDLVTCVHGLHYVGDKLGALQRIAGWLAEDGLFVANFDAGSIRDAAGHDLGRAATTGLRRAGFEVDTRARRISLRGGREVTLPYRFRGADPDAGPNYTGQPVVNSWYEQG